MSAFLSTPKSSHHTHSRSTPPPSKPGSSGLPPKRKKSGNKPKKKRKLVATNPTSRYDTSHTTTTSGDVSTHSRNSGSASLLDNIHRCPVCKMGLCDDDGLSMKQNFLKYKRDAEFMRKKLEDCWEGKPVRRSEEDVVVVATCGELFHKKCLLNYCSKHFGSIGRRFAMFQKTPGPTTCPRCNKHIMYSVNQEVDLDGHRSKAGGAGLFGRIFNDIRLKNQEIMFKRDKIQGHLGLLEERLKAAKTKLSAARKKRDQLETALPPTKALIHSEINKMKSRREEKVWIEGYIIKAQRVIEFMQKETPNTMRLYLNEIQSRPLEEIPRRTPIPRMLIPYLHKIADDDYCLFALSQVVEPRPYPGIKFELDDLLLGILKKVNPSLAQKLVARAKKSGSSLLRVYDEMFPDTCLKILKSYRDLRPKPRTKRTHRDFKLDLDLPPKGPEPIKDSRGNDLEITIMYMVDEEDEEELLKIPSTQHLFVEKASNFQLNSSNTTIPSSFITEADDDEEVDQPLVQVSTARNKKFPENFPEKSLRKFLEKSPTLQPPIVHSNSSTQTYIVDTSGDFVKVNKPDVEEPPPQLQPQPLPPPLVEWHSSPERNENVFNKPFFHKSLPRTSSTRVEIDPDSDPSSSQWWLEEETKAAPEKTLSQRLKALKGDDAKVIDIQAVKYDVNYNEVVIPPKNPPEEKLEIVENCQMEIEKIPEVKEKLPDEKKVATVKRPVQGKSVEEKSEKTRKSKEKAPEVGKKVEKHGVQETRKISKNKETASVVSSAGKKLQEKAKVKSKEKAPGVSKVVEEKRTQPLKSTFSVVSSAEKKPQEKSKPPGNSKYKPEDKPISKDKSKEVDKQEVRRRGGGCILLPPAPIPLASISGTKLVLSEESLATGTGGRTGHTHKSKSNTSTVSAQTDVSHSMMNMTIGTDSALCSTFTSIAPAPPAPRPSLAATNDDWSDTWKPSPPSTNKFPTAAYVHQQGAPLGLDVNRNEMMPSNKIPAATKPSLESPLARPPPPQKQKEDKKVEPELPKFIIECETVTKIKRNCNPQGQVGGNLSASMHSALSLLDHESAMKIQRAISKLCLEVNPPSPRNKRNVTHFNPTVRKRQEISGRCEDEEDFTARSSGACAASTSGRSRSSNKTSTSKAYSLKKDYVRDNIAAAFKTPLTKSKNQVPFNTRVPLTPRANSTPTPTLPRGRSKNNKKSTTLFKMSQGQGPQPIAATTSKSTNSGQKRKLPQAGAGESGRAVAKPRAKSVGVKVLGKQGEINIPVLVGARGGIVRRDEVGKRGSGSSRSKWRN